MSPSIGRMLRCCLLSGPVPELFLPTCCTQFSSLPSRVISINHPLSRCLPGCSAAGSLFQGRLWLYHL